MPYTQFYALISVEMKSASHDNLESDRSDSKSDGSSSVLTQVLPSEDGLLP
jgi:hypothetical protein